MYGRAFNINIIIRVFLIIASTAVFLLLFSVLDKEFYFTFLGMGILIAIQVYRLIVYIRNLNEGIIHFFSSIRNDDRGMIYSKASGKIPAVLEQSLKQINNQLQQVHREHEKQSIFLNAMVDGLAVGIISFNQTGEVSLLNKAAKKLLRIQNIKNIDQIKGPHPELWEIITKLEPGRTGLFKHIKSEGIKQLSLSLSLFKSKEHIEYLLSVQNIQNELEHNELDSWQKIIRILTHEISNSLSPVTSLANTTKRQFENLEAEKLQALDELGPGLITRTVETLDTIEDTGKSLMKFVGNYKTLTSLPSPGFERLKLQKIFDNLSRLYAQFSHIDIRFYCKPENLHITGDYSLIEKAMMNLINNSIEALESRRDGRIEIIAYKDKNDKTIIDISDNGKGVPVEIMEDIFTPFFTTRENGSGIGLSLVRQIMRLHNASISLCSRPNEKTLFQLIF